MDLFNNNPNQNLLPFDGEVFLSQNVLNVAEIDFFYHTLLNAYFWKQDELIIFGKQITTSRKVAWFGDFNYKYSYSKITKTAKLWTPELQSLKKLIELKTEESFNSCLLNLYHNGSEGMSWHSDNEKELGENPIIASLSLGAARKFSLKHKFKNYKVDIILESGGLLLMKGETQTKWLHSLPKTKKVTTPRINLTFRSIIKNYKGFVNQ